ncbi:uncharacterized protein LOC108865250 [Galendromus occidentalis]|uniref:Uncharacterized protein LOC108865250 n=1 Tax=Galendromus occidentalis TaxID=34638 RepID=A0AAJ7L8U0_9ACAR|nr:uncharacterized protein LOC108865250 [Galendromus occidentalis]
MEDTVVQIGAQLFTAATSKKKKTVKAKTEIAIELDEKSELSKTKEKSPLPGPSSASEATATKTLEPQLSSEEEDEEDEALSERLGIKRNDIVWVKQGQNVFWPGLVLKILNRGLRGKARTNTIQMRVFLIHNGSKLTVQSTKVESFDSPNRKEFLETGQKQKAALATEHARAAQKADKFLRERVLGVNIDPVRFFCLGETKVIQEHESSSSEDDEPPEEQVGIPQWELPSIEDLSAAEKKSSAARQAWIKNSKDSRRASNQALVEFITGGKVGAHLVGLYRGTVPSRRHDHYTSEDNDLRQKLKRSSWWGPIDDQLQQEAIFEYCHDVIERSKEVGVVKGLDTIKYAFEVFCPEAITKAICKLAMVDMETAAEIFEKGAQIVRACEALEQPEAEAVEPVEEESLEREKAIVETEEEVPGRETPAAEEAVVDEVLEGTVEAEETVKAETEEKMTAEPEPDVVPAEAEEGPSENLDTGEVVREELERLGVDSDLLKEIEQT